MREDASKNELVKYYEGRSPHRHYLDNLNNWQLISNSSSNLDPVFRPLTHSLAQRSPSLFSIQKFFEAKEEDGNQGNGSSHKRHHLFLSLFIFFPSPLISSFFFALSYFLSFQLLSWTKIFFLSASLARDDDPAAAHPDIVM